MSRCVPGSALPHTGGCHQATEERHGRSANKREVCMKTDSNSGYECGEPSKT
jgi:hypothetical protein